MNFVSSTNRLMVNLQANKWKHDKSC